MMCDRDFTAQMRVRVVLCCLAWLTVIASGNPQIMWTEMSHGHSNIKEIKQDPAEWINSQSEPTVSNVQFSSVVNHELLAYDHSRKTLVWTNLPSRRLEVKYLNGSTGTHVLYVGSSSKVRGLTVDWLSHNVYWTDDLYNWVMMVSLRNTQLFRMVITTDLDQPTGIVVYPSKGFLFFADSGSMPKIERATLAGESRQTIVSSGIQKPTGFTIDYAEDKLYWLDAGSDTVQRSTLDGTSREQVISEAGSDFFGIAIYQRYIFATDKENKCLRIYDKVTKEKYKARYRNFFTLLYDVIAYDSSRQKITSTPCSTKNCQDLCVIEPNGQAKCLCRYGHKVKPDGVNCEAETSLATKSYVFALGSSIMSLPVFAVEGGTVKESVIQSGLGQVLALGQHVAKDTLYFADNSTGKINKVGMTKGETPTVLLTGAADVMGLAVDWFHLNLYYTQEKKGTIVVATLDGSYQKTLLSNQDKPRGIAVDPKRRQMFWASGGSNPRIFKAGLDMSGKTAIVSTGLQSPRSVALDFAQLKLYWTDQQSGKLESANFDGTGRRSLIQKPQSKVLAITVYQDYYAWTEVKDSKTYIHWNEKIGYSTTERKSIAPSVTNSIPYDIITYDRYSQPVYSDPNPCADNGDCSHICLPTSSGRVCACPNGVSLQADGINCVGVVLCSAAISNGAFVGKCLRRHGSKCNVTCSTTHILSGSETITCNNGAWDRNTASICTLKTCPTLATPANANRDSCPTAATPGTECRFSCMAGYRASSGSFSRYCAPDRTWTSSPLICGVVTCPALTPIIRGSYAPSSCSVSGATYNNKCVASCDNGYKIAGTATQSCLQTGQWSGASSLPTCSIVRCPALQVINNGEYDGATCTSTGGSYGQACTGTCNTGYRLVGTAQHTCTASGEWSDKDKLPTCQIVQCSALSPINQGSFTDNTCTSSSKDYNTVCEAKCNVGYAISGTRSSRCLDSGAWSGAANPPKCTAIKCPGLTAPAHSIMTDCSAPYVYNSACKFVCRTGYRFNSGSNTRTCQLDTTWSGTPIACEAVRCPKLSIPENGWYQPTSCTSTGAAYTETCRAVCTTGYSSVGTVTQTCQATGTWSGASDPPRCTKKTCSALSVPAQATLSPASCGTTGGTYGDVCKVICNTGYRLQGPKQHECRDDRTWSDTSSPSTCIDEQAPTLVCPASQTMYSDRGQTTKQTSWATPQATDNSGGKISISQSVNSPATLPEGTRTIRVTATDSAGNAGYCSFTITIKVHRCSAPVAPSNGFLDGTCSRHFGSKCEKRCNEGYKLTGVGVMVCELTLPTATYWTNTAVSCTPITCPSLPSIANGKYSCSGAGKLYNTVCQASCDMGFELSGSQSQRCLASGEWSGKATPASCTAIKCPTPSIPAYSTLVGCAAPYTYNSVCQQLCHTGYRQTGGTSTRTCRQDKTWSGQPIVCQIVRCSALAALQNGRYDPAACVTSGAMYNQACKAACNTGFSLVGTQSQTCQASATWSSANDLPRCTKKKCPALSAPAHGALSPASCGTTGGSYGETCAVNCKPGYQLTGPSKHVCQDDQTWTEQATSSMCTDVQKPTLACPTSMVLSAGAGQTAVKASWSVAPPVDNSGGTIRVTHSITSPATLARGTHSVTITATDPSGNSASCTFNINIIVFECPALQAPRNGRLTSSSCTLHYGSECGRTCNEGFRLVGASLAVCQLSPTKAPYWTNSDTRCEAVTCSAPVKPPNSVISSCAAPYAYNEKCSQSCQTCHRAVAGTSTRLCLGQGVWSGTPIQCKRITCAPLLTVTMGTYEPSNCTSARVGCDQTCRATCGEGYEIDGPAQLRCKADGQWDKSTTPSCKPIQCPSLPVPAKTIVVACPQPANMGTKCQYQCQRGYTLASGTTTRVCQSNKAWDGSAPVCQIQKCGPILAPLGGRISPSSCTSGSEYGGVCTYHCDVKVGYTLEGDPSRTCRDNGQWTDVRNTPKCKDILAPNLQCPNDITVSAPRGQTSAIVSWSVTTPTDNSGSSVTVTQSKQSPATLTEGQHSIIVKATDADNNEKSCTFTVTVRVRRCADLVPPGNGYLTNAKCATIYGTTCQVTCNVGYKLTNGVSRTCEERQDTMYWTQPGLSCTMVTCATLSTPPNAVLSGCSDPYRYNSVCKQACRAGYKQVGTSTSRTCLATGLWSGEPVQCQIVTCAALPAVVNGGYSPSTCQTTGGQYRQVCRATCSPGYNIRGAATHTCQATATWSDNDNLHVCEDTSAPDVTCPTDKIFTASRGQTSAVASWDPPQSVDSSGRPVTLQSSMTSPQTLSEGNHTVIVTATDANGNKGTCRFKITINVIRCPAWSAPQNGRFIRDCSTHFGSQCTIACDSGYEIVGAATRTCEKQTGTGAQWQSTAPQCRVKYCAPLTVNKHVTVQGCNMASRQPFGTACQLSCKSGYRRQRGDTSRTCQANQLWSGASLVCDAVTCSALSVPSNGRLSPTSCSQGAKYGETCRIACNTGYQAAGPTSKECKSDGEWTQAAESTICNDVQAPSFGSTCPGDIHKNASPCSDVASITYNVPNATDNSGQDPNVYGPNDVFPLRLGLGSYLKRYSARDSARNEATCQFYITVQVITCGSLTPPQHGSILSQSCGNNLGSKVVLQCQAGYYLSGSSARFCDETGQWNGTSTTCSQSFCSGLNAIEHAQFQPSICGQRSVPAGQQCTVKCNYGFKQMGTSLTTCNANRAWSNSVAGTSCKDVTPPSALCPDDRTYILAPGASKRKVTWQVPKFSDNSGKPVTITSNFKQPSATRGPGFFGVEYVGTDGAGLTSRCKFYVTVEDKEPPKVLDCDKEQFIPTSTSPKAVTWKEPRFTDNVRVKKVTRSHNPGDSLKWGTTVVTYLAEDESKNTVGCNITLQISALVCKPLDPPKYGELACGSVGATTVCTASCTGKYKYVPGIVQPADQYKCSNGLWQPDANPPDCIDYNSLKGAYLPGRFGFHRYDGSCKTSAQQRTLEVAFRKALLNNGLSSACTDGRITCDFNDITTKCYKSKRRKRASESHDFDAEFTLNFKNTIMASKQFVQKLRAARQSLLDSLNSGIRMMVGGTDSVDSLLPSSYLGQLLFYCDPGQQATEEGCIPCPRGMYHNSTTRRCERCPAGTYQNESSRVSCFACPKGQSTPSTGSKAQTDCLDMCLPGRYSSTGFYPCQYCARGTFSPTHGARQCGTCVPTAKAVDKGATSLLECEGVTTTRTLPETTRPTVVVSAGPTNMPSANQQAKGLPIPIIAGGSAAAGVLILIIVVLIIAMRYRRKMKKKKQEMEETTRYNGMSTYSSEWDDISILGGASTVDGYNTTHIYDQIPDRSLPRNAYMNQSTLEFQGLVNPVYSTADNISLSPGLAAGMVRYVDHVSSPRLGKNKQDDPKYVSSLNDAGVSDDGYVKAVNVSKVTVNNTDPESIYSTIKKPNGR